nr:uncharacterized protein LOC108019292 isoform X2 [Drosophila suzukii]
MEGITQKPRQIRLLEVSVDDKRRQIKASEDRPMKKPIGKEKTERDFDSYMDVYWQKPPDIRSPTSPPLGNF